MAFFSLNLDQRSIEEILHDPEGPVAELLAEIAQRMTGVAEARVPYMKPENYAWSLRRGPKGIGPTQYMPRVAGWTAASIWYHPPANDASGRLFAGTNSAYAPTNWLEHGRKQGHMMETHPFLTEALFSAGI